MTCSLAPLQSSLWGENVTVFGCLNHEVPLTLGDNSSVTCETGRGGPTAPSVGCWGLAGGAELSLVVLGGAGWGHPDAGACLRWLEQGGGLSRVPSRSAQPPLSLPVPTESLAGFLLSVNATANLSRLRIPYPQTGSWYLSLRSLCTTDRG